MSVSLQNKKPYLHLVWLGLSVLILTVLYLFYNTRGNLAFALNLRVSRLPVFALVGLATAVATVVFQTIAKNNILSPNIIGLDSLYSLFQTLIIFFFGSGHLLGRSSQLNFIISTVLMVVASFGLFYIFFKLYPGRIFLLLMTGLIFGTLMRNLIVFFQALIDPNEFQTILSRTLVSFNTVDSSLIWLSLVIVAPIVIYLFFHSHTLDVLHLGDVYAKGLGVYVDREYFYLFILVSILTAVSTALVGPITFLGFLGANLAYRIMPSYHHTWLFLTASFITVLLLLASQFIVEHLLPVRTSIGVVIELIGGIYFLYLIIKERKQVSWWIWTMSAKLLVKKLSYRM